MSTKLPFGCYLCFTALITTYYYILFNCYTFYHPVTVHFRNYKTKAVNSILNNDISIVLTAGIRINFADFTPTPYASYPKLGLNHRSVSWIVIPLRRA